MSLRSYGSRAVVTLFLAKKLLLGRRTSSGTKKLVDSMRHSQNRSLSLTLFWLLPLSRSKKPTRLTSDVISCQLVGTRREGGVLCHFPEDRNIRLCTENQANIFISIFIKYNKIFLKKRLIKNFWVNLWSASLFNNYYSSSFNKSSVTQHRLMENDVKIY